VSENCFSGLPLSASMLSNLKSLGYEQMTPIQAKSLPSLLEGKDLIGKARTGSGKTAAFGISLLHKLPPGRSYGVRALVLCPTRELATQVAKELRRLARFRDNTKIISICGGQPIGPQIGSLEHGADVVVGTPGRIQDHLRKRTLDINQVDTVVLDEADRMLEMGFKEEVSNILSHTPEKRQTLLFSATYPEGIQKLSSDFQQKPVQVEVESLHDSSAIEQVCYQTHKEHKEEHLLRVLSYHRPASCVVFCSTRQQCQDLSQALYHAGHSARPLHGELDQKDRDRALALFSNGSTRILVATDVAARGLDVDDLAAVVNYDLPKDPQVYVHRIGRTGRAGKNGIAINLMTDKEQYKLDAIEEYQQQKLEVSPASAIPKNQAEPEKPEMMTICIASGRRNKIRPGDILGALTRDSALAGSDIGKIEIHDFLSYIAVRREHFKKALEHLNNGSVKGKKVKARRA